MCPEAHGFAYPPHDGIAFIVDDHCIPPQGTLTSWSVLHRSETYHTSSRSCTAGHARKIAASADLDILFLSRPAGKHPPQTSPQRRRMGKPVPAVKNRQARLHSISPCLLDDFARLLAFSGILLSWRQIMFLSSLLSSSYSSVTTLLARRGRHCACATLSRGDQSVRPGSWRAGGWTSPAKSGLGAHDSYDDPAQARLRK